MAFSDCYLAFSPVYAGGCVIFKSMIEIGFLDILHGSASLTQMLSSSAWHRKPASSGDHESSIEYARYSLMATRALRRRIDNPAQRATLETIIAILTFAAFAVCVDRCLKADGGSCYAKKEMTEPHKQLTAHQRAP